MRMQIVQGGNGYTIGPVSGLLTGVAAGTAANGHIFAARWAPAAGLPKLAMLTRLRVGWVTIAGFTAAQEVGLDVSKVTAYTAAHTGGTALVATGLGKTRSFHQIGLASPDSAFNDIRIGTTGALTSGTQTFDPTPFRQAQFSELAAAATVPKGIFQLFYSNEDVNAEPIVLAANEGIVVRNTIGMGAAGTARVTVEMSWVELNSY